MGGVEHILYLPRQNTVCTFLGIILCVLVSVNCIKQLNVQKARAGELCSPQHRVY